MHDLADEFIASAGSPSAPIVTPPDFHFASLNPGFALPSSGVSSPAPTQYDLLVVGYMGHSALYNRIIGSTTDRLVELAPCQVLVIK